MKIGTWTLKTKLTVAVMMAAGITAVVIGGYYAWLSPPPPLPQTADDVLTMIRSARYARLPEYRQQEYLDHGRRLLRDLSPEQRRALYERAGADESARQALREVRRGAMIQRAIEYARADVQARTRLLDTQIDRMEERRARRTREGGRRPGRERGGDSGNRAERRGRFRERMQDRFETGNPQLNSLIGEYFRALRARREQRRR